MKVTPNITADLEDYPELAKLADTALRRVVELMQIHDIADMRRIRKTGVFDHQYTKDVVNPIGVRTVPSSVAAARYSVGKALLDYLETIGIGGISLEFAKEEVATIEELWSPRPKQTSKRQQKPKEEDLKPEAVQTVDNKKDREEKPKDENLDPASLKTALGPTDNGGKANDAQQKTPVAQDKVQEPPKKPNIPA